MFGGLGRVSGRYDNGGLSKVAGRLDYSGLGRVAWDGKIRVGCARWREGNITAG